ncbi:carbohydrate porin [Candidatus Latescibacterota bacterium]
MKKLYFYSLLFILIAFILLFCESHSIAQTINYQQNKRRQHSRRKNLSSTYLKRNISFDYIYTGDFFSNIAGGHEQKSDYCYVMDFLVTGELDSLFWGRNASFGFDIVGINGVNPSDAVGDFQGISNIAAPKTLRPYETWFQIDIINEKLSLLFGMYDINSEFYFNETAALFLNSSFAIGPEFSQNGCIGAPTYPNPGLGLRLKTKLSDSISLKTALMDGKTCAFDAAWSEYYTINRNEGALLAMEVTFASNEEKTKTLAPSSKRFQRRRHRMRSDRFNNTFHQNRNALYKDNQYFINFPQGSYNKFSLGSWYYNTGFDTLTENNNPESLKHWNNWGFYSTGEKILWQDDGNPIEAVSAFFHVGISDKNVNKVDMSFACGLVYSGIFLKHFQNQIGVGFTAAHRSDRFQSAFYGDGRKGDEWEMISELSCRSQVNKVLSFQPDIQYIVNPGFEQDYDNALVLGIRLEMAF